MDDNFRELVNRYNNEMKQYIKHSAPSVVPAQTTPTVPEQTTPSAPEQTTPDAPEQTTPTVPTPAETAPTLPTYTGEGYIVVEATTARGSVPVQGAMVVVTKKTNTGEHLIYSVMTDRSGQTPRLSLPTVSMELSQQPETEKPYVDYSIKTTKQGYFTVENRSVPVFDEQTAFQPVDMVPLPENYKKDRTIVVDEAPVDL